MGRWASMLGGLLVWTVHFVGVYVLASIGDVASRADDPAWRLAIVAFSGLCLAAAAALLVRAFRDLRDPRAGTDATARLLPELSALGAGLALIAIAWQTLPAVIGY